MAVKKRSIRKEIEALDIQENENDIDDFDNPLSDAIQNLITDDVQTLSADDISSRFSSLRTKTYTDDSIIKGKSKSRNKIFKHYYNSLEENQDSKLEEKLNFDNEQDEESGDDNEEEEERDGEDESSGGEDKEDDEITSDDYDDNDDYDITASGSKLDETGEENMSEEAEDEGAEDILYSKSSKSEEIEKGLAVQQQIGLCDILLESRIRLQKGIQVFNKFPTESVITTCNLEDELKKEFTDAKQNVTKLLETLISLQNKLAKQTDNNKSLKRKPLEEEEEKADETSSKKRKLDQYSNVLSEINEAYVPYRNEAIQKWNDKTKIASGKLAKSNFSAFDQSILDQINFFLNDKQKLIKRTQQKKSNYHRIGEKNKNTEASDKSPDDKNFDSEVFDDDDFYHKILRDYIDKKKVDVQDPKKLGKQWIELQKLRSKMKRKIDVKCTKGRKLRYTVHEKLANFMAPLFSNKWSQESENELFKSLFGKKK